MRDETESTSSVVFYYEPVRRSSALSIILSSFCLYRVSLIPLIPSHPPPPSHQVDLRSNQLSGTLPSLVSALTPALAYLNLGGNPHLTGPLPPSFSSLTRLMNLSTSGDSGLAGPLPTSWSTLTGLTRLELGGCGFTAGSKGFRV